MKRRGTIIIISILVLLAAAIAVLVVLNDPGEAETGTITIVRGDETVRVFTMEEITAMPYIEVYKKITSSSFKDIEGTFRGVPLRALIESADATLLDGATQIVTRSEDAFATAFSAEEVLESDSVFIAYSLDGESLGTLAGGGTGPFRVIITDDEFGNRSAKYLFKIEIR